MSEHSAEKDAPFTIPGRDWLAQALCGWHDAEDGRWDGEPFPCGYCAAQAEYVVEQAHEPRVTPPATTKETP